MQQKTYPSKDRLIISYKFLWKRLQRQPTHKDFTSNCYSSAVLLRVFGPDGWRTLVAAAGGHCRKPRVEVTEDEVIRNYFTLQEKLGRQPRLADYTRHFHTAKVVERLFGSPGWKNMLKVVGADVQRKKSMQKKFITAYLMLQRDHGENPTLTQFCNASGYTYKQLSTAFGKQAWRALHAAAKKRGSDLDSSYGVVKHSFEAQVVMS